MKNFLKNVVNVKINWTSLAYWKKGLLIGVLFYLGICVLPLLLCFSNFLGIINEGYEGAGWILIFLGLPTTLLEILIEEYNPSFFMQVIYLLALTFINCIGIGSFLGLIIGRKRNIAKAVKETSIKL